MDGYEGFIKMQEITKHLHSEVDWWQGEGLDAASIAVVLRSVAREIDPEPKRYWSDEGRASYDYMEAVARLSDRRTRFG